MDAGTLQPAAGAQGELTGLLLIRALLTSRGNPRKKVSDPGFRARNQSGTVVIAGYEVETCRSDERGQTRHRAPEEIVTDDVAALMVTNPSTLGLRAAHRRGRRTAARARRPALYGRGEHERAGRCGATRRFRRGRDAPEPAQDLFDAARRRRPGRGTRAGKENTGAVPSRSCAGRKRRSAGAGREPAAIHRPRSRVRGQLRSAGARAGLHAGVRTGNSPGHRRCGPQRKLHPQKLEDVYELPFNSPSMHEVVFSDARQKKTA
jgi:glycine dehydrogenase subunit 2